MEQIRLIKEMRERDRRYGRTGSDVFPRFMVWENVFGAFSSNNGEDFRAVLEETARIAEPGVSIPRYEGGRWTNAGVIIGNGFSVGWRTHDAQYWGVPQRRRRISLVADFGGFAAPEILFERKSLSGDTEPGGEARERIAGDIETGIAGADLYNGTVTGETAVTLNANSGASGNHAGPTVLVFSQNGSGDTTVHPKCNAITANQNPSRRGTAMVFGFQPQAGGNTGCAIMEDAAPCLGTTQKPAVYDARGNGDGETAPTITGDHYGHVNDYMAVCVGNGQSDNTKLHELCPALSTMHDQQAVMVSSAGGTNEEIAGTLDASYYKGAGARNGNERTVVAVDCRNGTENEVNGTLQAKPSGGTSVNLGNVCRTGMVVRRLTPLECERLQAFPDNWTDIGEWTDEKGKKHAVSDSSRYRALGNSIALPFWYWLLRRIMAHCREKTMGSLFDGIGGFPLCWNAAGGETLWNSEIDPFCIAVTKKHFGDEDAGAEGDWKEYVPGAAERSADEI